MDNSAEATSGGAPSSSPANVSGQLSEAFTNLTRGLQEGNFAAQKQQKEACATYMKTWSEVAREATRRAMEAYHEYAKSAQEALNKQGAQQAVVEAYQNYVATVQGLQEDASRRLQDAYHDLISTSSQAAIDTQRQVRQHCIDYLKNIQRIWAGMDVESVVV